MLRCVTCGLFCWVDMLPQLKEAAKCYHGGNVTDHDWRYKDGSPYRPE